jgi:hypothetical protein
MNRVNFKLGAAADDRAEVEWRLQLRPMTHQQRGGMTTQFRKPGNRRPNETPLCASPSKSLCSSQSAPNIGPASYVKSQQQLPNVLDRKKMHDGEFRNYTIGCGGLDCLEGHSKLKLPKL